MLHDWPQYEHTQLTRSNIVYVRHLSFGSRMISHDQFPTKTERERERERERDRQTDKQTKKIQRQRERQTDRQRQTETERDCVEKSDTINTL